MKRITISMLFFCWALVTSAQEKNQEKEDKESIEFDEKGRQIFDHQKERKGVKYNFVPMPSYDPSSKWGVSLINMVNYYPTKGDLVSPPSSTSLFLSTTTNRSYMGGLRSKMFLKEDKWRLTAGAFYGNINQEMHLSPNPDNALPTEIAYITSKVTMANFMVEHKLVGRWYAGIGYMYSGRSVSGRDENSQDLLTENGFSEDFVHTHGIRYKTTYDTRDNINYPYTGIMASLTVDQMLGEESQNILVADYRQFFTLGNNVSNVLAVHGVGRFVSADASRNFWSSYGRAGATIQRGYETGEYMDRNLMNIEVEYRKQTPWMNNKLGFVAAVGTGKVFGKDHDNTGVSNKFSDAEWLPMATVGVRYKLLPYERLNLKFDYSRGKSGGVFYFGISEAF